MSYRKQWDNDTIQDLIDRCLNEGRNLTKWERDFLESIDNQFDTVGGLSEKQLEILDRIYTEKV